MTGVTSTGDAMTAARTTVDEVPFTDLGAMTREVRGAVVEAWTAILDSGRFIGGEVCERFERDWAAYCGTSEAVGVANGTDALRLTLTALGIGAGDEVIVPANTFVATAEAVVLAGATPRFADVSPQTLLLTPDTLESAVTHRTRAVIVVPLYGHMPDMDGLRRAAGRNGLALIEDAAQAHGATWRGRRAGSFGHAGCFSFYPGKNLGAFGDAGAVVTSDSALAARLRCLRDHGRAGGSHYQHALVGTNSRLDAVQAAVLTAKLVHLDGWTRARRGVAAQYRDALADGPVRLLGDLPAAEGVYHLAVARVSDRDGVQARLASRGVRTAIHYPIPCHKQVPYLRYAAGPLPVVERAATEILSLPLFPHMSDEQVAVVCKAVQDVVPGEWPDV
jgi:dTDP-4-amino-4,6-dideoxygalactose transaminase